MEALTNQACFDVIVSNPPYVPTAAWEQLPRDIKDYEPRLALDGGPDGLDVIRALVAEVHRLLQPGGLLALEVGQGQAEAVKQLLDDSGAYTPAEIHPDYQRIGRVVLARRLGGFGRAATAGDPLEEYIVCDNSKLQLDRHWWLSLAAGLGGDGGLKWGQEKADIVNIE